MGYFQSRPASRERYEPQRTRGEAAALFVYSAADWRMEEGKRKRKRKRKRKQRREKKRIEKKERKKEKKKQETPLELFSLWSFGRIF